MYFNKMKINFSIYMDCIAGTFTPENHATFKIHSQKTPNKLPWVHNSIIHENKKDECRQIKHLLLTKLSSSLKVTHIDRIRYKRRHMVAKQWMIV